MLDVAGTSQAVVALGASPVLTSMGVSTASSAAKATWNMMIEGTWALLQPKIQKFFPTRTEISTYVVQKINETFIQHHASNAHVWAGICVPVYAGATVATPDAGPIPIPLSTFITKRSRPVPTPASPTQALGSDMASDLEIGAPIPELVEAFGLSPALPYLTM